MADCWEVKVVKGLGKWAFHFSQMVPEGELEGEINLHAADLSVVRCDNQLWRMGMFPRESAESTYNLQNHSGAITMFENHWCYVSTEPTIFC